MENLLRQMAGSQIIAVNVYDITNDTMPLVMYGHTNVERSENTYVSSLDFGDPSRSHEMRCRCVGWGVGLFHALLILPYVRN